jgi:ABC-2 type transport system permease protein
MREASAVAAIAQRDLMKLLRDRPRLITTLLFPLLFIGVLGGSLQTNLGRSAGLNFVALTFTGVLAQTLFQSTSQGLISLINDRENDFSQEMFVAPISRYSIIIGKILGESLVALPQGVTILLFGVLLLRPSPAQVLVLVLASLLVSFFGGAFGVLVLANFASQQTANQVFTFVMLPQYFLAGVFFPVKVLPPGLDLLSLLSPMRYAVDLVRGLFYAGQPDYAKIVLEPPVVDLAVISGLCTVFLVMGTALFVRGERNR